MIYELDVEFHDDFIKVEKDKITIGVKSKPLRGEANKEIIKKLGKHFGVSTSSVTIKSGHKSRHKIVEIQT